MSITFSADEIFEIAQQIERNGAKFYRKAAETVEGENRNLLLRLAEMEDQHEKTFATMRENLLADKRISQTYDQDDQIALFLRALAEGKVFDIKADPCENLTGSKTLQDILKTAIELEKDSIIFYLGMKDIVQSSHDKQMIDHIIAEEKKHIVDLSNQLAAS